ncbi:MAG: extracellular solute-binding protein [Chloroflexi bacterium]|nr:extracellular solute-binding protein [Chloroflexota bacterium]
MSKIDFWVKPAHARLAALGIVVLLLTSLLGACGDAATPTSSAAVTAGAGQAGAKRFDGQTVTVAVGSFMSSGVNMFKADWEKKTGAKVQVVEIPFGDLYQRLYTSFSTGAGEFDIAIYASNWIPEFAQANYILNLEKYYPEKTNWNDVVDKTKKLMYVNGQRYSVPLDGDVIIGYYRKDAFENDQNKAKFKAKYGYDLAAPTTWQQYQDIAEFFTGWDWSGDGKPDYGVLEAQGPKDVGPFIFSARAAAYAANPKTPGSLFFDPDTMEPSINNPGWVQALKDWIAIKKYGPAEMATYGGGTMRGNFVAGNYALALDWADVGVQAQDENSSTIKGKLGYYVLPGSKKVWNIKTKAWDESSEVNQAPFLGWGGWHGSVAAKSKVPDAAWDFLNYLDSTENSLKAVTTPGTARNPYRTQHFENPQLWADSPTKYMDAGPYLQVLKQSNSLPNTQFDLRIPKSGRYSEVLDNWVQQALAGTITPEEALNKAANDWKQITNEAGLEQQKKLYRELEGLS